TGRVSSGALGGIPRPEVPRQLSSALAEAGLLWIITLVGIQILCGRQRGSALAACCLLTAVPLAANRRIAQTSRDEEVFAAAPFARRVAHPAPRREFRTLGESLSRPYVAPEPYRDSALAFAELPRRSWIQYSQLFWGRGTLFNEDFDTGDLSRMESLRQVSVHAATFRDSAVFFQNLGLRWGIRYRGQGPVAGFRRFDGDAVQDWDELEGALPDIRLATRWAEEPNPLHALNRIGRLGLGEV